MTRTPVYVVGFPKSGCTWLTRLLGDALNCPTGGSMPGREDRKEIATEGLDRPGPYRVRKAHFVLLDRKGGPAVPAPHRLAWRNLTDERVIFIVRDPRDIAVSTAYYFGNISLKEALGRLCHGDSSQRGPWAQYVKGWLAVEFDCVYTTYEALLENGKVEVVRILEEAKLPVDGQRIAGAVKRQSFARRKADIAKHGHKLARGKAFNLQFMRKGIAGDWKNHFTRPLGKMAHQCFGELMKELGYISDNDWWKGLPVKR